MKEDLADMLKDKLGFVMGKSRLYRSPYVDALAVMITGPLVSILANTLLNLGKLVLEVFARSFVFFVFNWNRFLLVFVTSPELDSFLG